MMKFWIWVGLIGWNGIFTASVDGSSFCPNIFYQASRIILQSPFLLSSNPSISLPCHSCIANNAMKQEFAPLCYAPGMDGFDPNYPIYSDCHCLTLGLTEPCARFCLPNPLCTPTNSAKPECTKCVQSAHSFCTDTWNTTCYETCQLPQCITECSMGSQCHPNDAICSACVTNNNKDCQTSLISYARGWSASCTNTCYSKDCNDFCNRRCGDGTLTPDEACDDGNKINNDGCSSSCQIEQGCSCVTNSNKASTCHGITCGDGIVETGEECDDGNTVSNDGCSNTCRIEKGIVCTKNQGVSTCHSVCGDGIVVQSTEGCDDGNTISKDGCSSTCQPEYGYSCAANATTGISSCAIVCGDGVVAGTEECDDGNAISNDGCSSTCTVEKGYRCQSTSSGTSICNGICGDGIVAFPIEECDDSNHVSGDGCSFLCAVERGYNCTPDAYGKSACSAICGDGYMTTFELCDDGNKNSNDGCSSICIIEPGWSCDNTKSLLPISVCKPICGDRLKVGWEQCDEVSSTCQNCKRTSTAPATPTPPSTKFAMIAPTTPAPANSQCGNGVVSSNEDCDDGNNRNDDGCSTTCRVERGFKCSTTNSGFSACMSVCGDGIKIALEDCDDGNLFANDGCSAKCTVESGFSCTATLTANSVQTSICREICGNGIVQVRETCDDGNTVSNDGCSSTCSVEYGYTCVESKNKVSVCKSTCGDGLLVASTEQCDDGNMNNSDGCSENCQIENYYSCNSTSGTSVCSPICGDGVITAPEDCDDGNLSNGDGCSSTCRFEPGYACSLNAQKQQVCSRVPKCGDGVVDDNERCDDGNLSNNDGCSDRCIIEALYACTNTPVSDGSKYLKSACARANCNNVRPDWYQMSNTDKDAFKYCLDAVYMSGLYQKFVGIHVYTPNDQYAHHTNGFVAWHRKWLLAVTSLMRSMGGACSCINIPYWDWTQDASRMQFSSCSTKEDCYPIMKDFGGGGRTSDTYRTIGVYNDPSIGRPTDSVSGYCVRNNVTKNWRANFRLGPYASNLDANCPIIRRCWGTFDDMSDDGTYFASPMASSAFLGLASNLGRARTYDDFSRISLGDIHVLPHDKSGAILRTFISPADPIFLLHHCNIDRVWALWESCHSCINLPTSSRQNEGTCYSSSNSMDGIQDTMNFFHYDDLGNNRYNRVLADSATEWREWFPQGFLVPGDMMDINSLKDYAYSYQSGPLDAALWKTSGCAAKSKSSMLLRSHGFVYLQSDATATDSNSNNVVDDLNTYLNWLDSLTCNIRTMVNSLQSSNLFILPFLNATVNGLAGLEAYVADIAATCECMQLNRVLLNRTSDTIQASLVTDVSAQAKRKWDNDFQIRSCFHRLVDMTENDITQRQYCNIILSNTFEADLMAFINEMISSVEATLSKSSSGTTIMGSILNYLSSKIS